MSKNKDHLKDGLGFTAFEDPETYKMINNIVDNLNSQWCLKINDKEYKYSDFKNVIKELEKEIDKKILGKEYL